MSALLDRNELFGLLGSLCNETLSPLDRVRLEAVLAEHPEAREAYFDYIDMHLQLRRWQKTEGRKPGGVELPADASPFTSTSPDSAIGAAAELPHSTFPAVSPIPTPLSPQFVDRPFFSYIVASLLMCAMLLSAWAYKINRDVATIGPDPRVIGEHETRMRFVGRITGMKECRWEEDDPGTLVGASVPLGREYAISAGLLEITYDSGARVILEGPCRYKADSRDGGFLQVGKLVARVEKKVASGEWRVARKEGRGERGEGRDGLTASTASDKLLATGHWPLATSPQSPIPSPLPLFAVRTPSAIVTDLGTEFGVEVNELGDTSTHVFQGVVKVRADVRESGDTRIREANNPDSQIVLTVGESARVEKDQTAVARLLKNVKDGDAPARFVRGIPRHPGAGKPAFIRDSADFPWKYEMDADPATQDLDDNPGPDWRRCRGGIQLNGDGTATLAVADGNCGCLVSGGQGDSYRSSGHVWNNIDDDTGYTAELRVKAGGATEWHGYTLGLYFTTVSSVDELSSVLVIARECTLWDHTSKYLADNNRNDNDFHVFRIAQEPNGGKYHVWRDGVLIRLTEGFRPTGQNRIQFGDMSTISQCGPNVVDYIRITTGVYAPPRSSAIAYPLGDPMSERITTNPEDQGD